MKFVDLEKDNGQLISVNPESITYIEFLRKNESLIYFISGKHEYIKGSIQEIKEKMLKV